MFSKNICSYLKQKKIFFFASPLSKNIKGGAGNQVGEKRTFGGRQKFLADGVAGEPKNRLGVKLGHIPCPSSRILNLNQKQKSYANLKLAYSKNSKKHVCPPPLWKCNRTFRQDFPEMKNEVCDQEKKKLFGIVFFFSFFSFLILVKNAAKTSIFLPKYQLFLRQNVPKTLDFDFRSSLSQKEDLCAFLF